MGETLRDGAVLRIVFEAVRDRDVEGAVAVGVLAREQDALLGLDELDRCVENERAHVVRGLRGRDAFVHLLQLPAELAVPLAFGTPRLLEATKEDPLRPSGLLGPPKSLLDPLALVALALGLLGSVRRERLELAVGLPDLVLAFAQLAGRFGLCPAQSGLQSTGVARTPPGIEPEQGPERESNQSDDLGAVQSVAVAPRTISQAAAAATRTTAATGSTRCTAWGSMASPAERCPGRTRLPWFTAGRLSAAARRSVNALHEPFAANVRALEEIPRRSSIPPLRPVRR